MRSLRLFPKTMAPSRPLPTGRAEVHSTQDSFGYHRVSDMIVTTTRRVKVPLLEPEQQGTREECLRKSFLAAARDAVALGKLLLEQ
jgi:hypothetical protein